MERDVKSFFKGAALDPLGRLNSPSPLSLRDISPHCGESPRTPNYEPARKLAHSVQTA